MNKNYISSTIEFVLNPIIFLLIILTVLIFVLGSSHIEGVIVYLGFIIFLGIILCAIKKLKEYKKLQR